MRSLRKVVFRRIVMVALISFLLSAAFTYYYYRNIHVGQMIYEDRAKLSQTVRQLEYMSDDIAKFSFTLIISQTLQSFYKSYNSLDTFGQFATLAKTLSFVDDYKGLRKEVASFALVLPDGQVFWNEAGNDQYFSDRMKEPWYQNFIRSGEKHAFTEPHKMFITSNSHTEGTVISFIVNVRDVEQPGRMLGQLILNLDYSHFESLLDFGAVGFEDFVWMNEAGSVLYWKENEQAGQAPAATLASEFNHKPEGAYKVKNGFVLVEQFEGINWRLATFISQQSLMERGRVVLYLLGFFSLVITTLILLLMMPIIYRITRPIMRLYHAMNAVSAGNLHMSVHIKTGDELEKLGHGFNRMTRQLQIHLEESIRFEQDKRELEMELLLSQLNPHFVYNTLNAVIYMAQKQGNEDIVRMVGSFIRVLQDAVKMGGAQSLVPLREDIALLRDYIAIQSYRYADLFQVVWELDDHALECPVPRNLTQPLVENAIFHGICPKDDSTGTIRISASVSEGSLNIRIADDGIGMEEEQLLTIWDKGEKKRSPGLRHIGLSNTKKRLEHLYGRQASISISSELNQGTTVSIQLPVQVLENARCS